MALVSAARMFGTNGWVPRGRRRALPVLVPLAKRELFAINRFLYVGLVHRFIGLFPIGDCKQIGFTSCFARRFLPAGDLQGPRHMRLGSRQVFRFILSNHAVTFNESADVANTRKHQLCEINEVFPPPFTFRGT